MYTAEQARRDRRFVLTAKLRRALSELNDFEAEVDATEPDDTDLQFNLGVDLLTARAAIQRAMTTFSQAEVQP